ncbi:flagellar hook-basal body complex protein FliE [Alkalibacillus aidingensis]|uniref:flagellar hook-basal body complex protein FliE n=1 Tax=Alkalibacillus aidingensis TaxID=2747607 RepID=UPI0016612C24|nr:flagellar hook-basal body complex protein FliE [Alkalibacillus aidingensis]
MNAINNQLFTQALNQPTNNNRAQQVTPNEAHQSFANTLKNAINEVNKTQHESNVKTEQLINGEAKDLHDVMITAEKAGVTLQTATEIQNKAIEAYREVMRMQI